MNMYKSVGKEPDKGQFFEFLCSILHFHSARHHFGTLFSSEKTGMVELRSQTDREADGRKDRNAIPTTHADV